MTHRPFSELRDSLYERSPESRDQVSHKVTRLRELIPNQNITVAFDVDDCLYKTYGDDGVEWEYPNQTAIDILKGMANSGCHIIVWSGGGADYAEMWCKRLWVDRYVDEYRAKPKPEQIVDIAFDDQPVTYGRVNIIV